MGLVFVSIQLTYFFGKKKDQRKKPQTIKKMAIGTYISIIALNVNGSNAPTQRNRLAEWIQTQGPYVCWL